MLSLIQFFVVSTTLTSSGLCSRQSPVLYYEQIWSCLACSVPRNICSVLCNVQHRSLYTAWFCSIQWTNTTCKLIFVQWTSLKWTVEWQLSSNCFRNVPLRLDTFVFSKYVHHCVQMLLFVKTYLFFKFLMQQSSPVSIFLLTYTEFSRLFYNVNTGKPLSKRVLNILKKIVCMGPQTIAYILKHYFLNMWYA